MKQDSIKKLPNRLSIGRMAGVPAVMALLLIPFGGKTHFVLAFVLYVLCAVTDFLDGFIARRYNATSAVGKFIDPVADKLLMISVMIWITVEISAVWMTVILLVTAAREFLVSGFRLAASATGGKVLAAGWMGKVKTATGSVALGAYLLSRCMLPRFCYTVFLILIAVSTLFCVISCVDYLARNMSILTEADK